MNLALFAQASLWTPLHSLLRRLAGRNGTTPPLATRPSARPALRSHRSGYSCTPAARALPVHRPLRVVRVMEAGQPRSQVGRMVISGRMADVCAELDRLAACEAARS